MGGAVPLVLRLPISVLREVLRFEVDQGAAAEGPEAPADRRGHGAGSDLRINRAEPAAFLGAVGLHHREVRGRDAGVVDYRDLDRLRGVARDAQVALVLPALLVAPADREAGVDALLDLRPLGGVDNLRAEVDAFSASSNAIVVTFPAAVLPCIARMFPRLLPSVAFSNSPDQASKSGFDVL
jgi:hypothetical protein